MAESNGFDLICPGCKYQQLEVGVYDHEAVQYCNKSEYGIIKCPRADKWRAYFANKKKMKSTP